MRIHAKLIILTCILVLVASALFFVYARLEFKRTAVLFHGQQKDIESIFDRISGLKSKTLEALTVDYTHWDEFVGYVRKLNPVWAEQNLKPVIPTFDVDLLVVYDPKFFPVCHFTSDGNERLYDEFIGNITLDGIFQQERVRHFYIHVPGGVLEVYAATIHPTNDPDKKTQPQGSMFVARIWDNEYIEEISKITDCQLSLVYPVGRATLVNKDQQRAEAIQFSRILRDWKDNPVARVDAVRVSESMVQFKKMSQQEFIVILFFVLFIALVYIRFILAHVYGPLALISRALKENKLQYISGMRTRKNEFGEIARLIFKFSENEVQLAREVELLKIAEDRLEKEYGRVQEYLDIAGVMIMILDLKGNISMANKKSYAVLGYDEPELLGLNWFDSCLPESGREGVRGVFDSLVLKGEIIHEYHENEVLRKDGQIRVIAFHNAALRNKNAQIIGLLISGEDITERKKVEAELSRVSEELRVIIDSSRSMIYYKDKENRFILVNKAFTEIAGLPKEEVEGKTAFEIFPENARKYWDDDLEVISAKQKKIGILESLTTSRGEVVWLSTDKIPYLDEQGNVIGVVGFSLDITEYKRADDKLRESEERYRVIFNASHDALMTLEPPDFRFTSCNAAAVQMFGFKDESECVKFGPWDVSPENQPDGSNSFEDGKEKLKTVLEKGSSYFEWTHKRIDDGREFPCIIMLSVFNLGGKKIIQANVRDITERKRIEYELMRKTEFLEAQKEASLDGLLVVDEYGKKVMINKRLIELWGIPRDIVEDENDESLLRFVVDRTKDPRKFMERVGYLYAHKEEKGRDEIEFKNGMVLDRYSSPVIDKNGKYFGRIWTFRDITEIRQAEEELKKDLHDLEVFYKASIGREERILELKKQIKELEKKLGGPAGTGK